MLEGVGVCIGVPANRENGDYRHPGCTYEDAAIHGSVKRGPGEQGVNTSKANVASKAASKSPVILCLWAKQAKSYDRAGEGGRGTPRQTEGKI